MEKETTLNFKIYTPLKKEYDGTLVGIYKGVTEEEDPKAVIELNFNRDFLMKHVITDENEDNEKLLEIISDIDKKVIEIEEREKKKVEKRKIFETIKDFCGYLEKYGYFDDRLDSEKLIETYFKDEVDSDFFDEIGME